MAQTPPADTRVTTLPSGLRVVSERLDHASTVSLGIWIGAGSRHEEEDEHGLSHLLEHMAFKGTRRRSARRIAEEIEAVGGDINAATSVEYTCFTARVLPEDLGLAVDILADIITEPAFDQDELKREKGVILQEIAAVEDTPDDLVYDLLMARAFPDQAIGRAILGTPATVRSFTPASLSRYLQRHYAAERMVVAAAGAIDHDRLVSLAQDHLGRFASSGQVTAPPPPRFQGGEVRRHDDHEQMHLVMAWPGRSFAKAEHFPLQVFANVLGGGLSSRLFQEVREARGLAYSIDAFHWPFSDTGLFGISAGCGVEQTAELLEVSLGCLEAAARTASEAEVLRAKAQMKVGLLAALETPGGVLDHLARQMLAHGKVASRQEISARLDAVSVDHVRAAGLALLAAKPVLAVVGPNVELPSLDEWFRRSDAAA